MDGKVACVTGGASGIGAAAAVDGRRRCAGRVILDRDGAAAEATAGAIGGCAAMALDVASEAAIDRVYDIARQHGRIDVMVANAGINIRRTAADCSLGRLERRAAGQSDGRLPSSPGPPPGTCARHGGPWSSPRRS
ncbi:MAG: SDR family NAD(P)-dependent oxidoreductase [Geminicoccaceae bacterium]